MKKYLTFLFLFMACVTFAQPKFYSITRLKLGKFKEKKVQRFDYQDNGLTVKTQTWTFQPIDSTPTLTEESMQRFRSDGQLISDESRRRWQNAWFNNVKTDNAYNANGCRVESKSTDFDIYNQESWINVSRIQTNEKCQILSDTTTRISRNYTTQQFELDSIYGISRTEYDNQDSITAVRYYGQNRLRPTPLTAWRTIDYTRRSDGKVVNIYDFFPSPNDFGYQRYTSIGYNAKGQMAMKVLLHRGFGSYKDSTRYTYNSEGRLTTEVRFSYRWRLDKLDNTFTTDYEYYCDGLLKSRTETPADTSNTPITKEIYAYTEAAICAQKETFDFTIAPNPAQIQATITTENLSSAGCTLTIYNLAGETVQSYNIGYRTATFDFSTANLVSGTYLVRLTNDKNSVTKKLVVMH